MRGLARSCLLVLALTPLACRSARSAHKVCRRLEARQVVQGCAVVEDVEDGVEQRATASLIGGATGTMTLTKYAPGVELEAKRRDACAVGSHGCRVRLLPTSRIVVVVDGFDLTAAGAKAALDRL